MIYIAAHKAFPVPELEGYIPLQVGACGKESLGFLRDDEGDQISAKNPNFCELTGVYWIWKNTQDEYKGLVHYRRYFGKSNVSGSPKKIYPYEELTALLSGADVVLPYREYLLQDAKEELLISCCTEPVFDRLRACVERLYPDDLEAFDAFFAQNELTLFNMMFCRGELFDAYCSWLFDILFELEKEVDLSTLNDYQQRLYGFLAERLLNVWIRSRHLRTVHVKVVNTEMSMGEKLQLLRRRRTNRMRYNRRQSASEKQE